ncbi:MAG TPA: hypothetical protein VFY21_02660 [Xanthobacteraceae bacterium]|nr:hypothetical protein [Xanthobacteraceae bacterium]
MSLSEDVHQLKMLDQRLIRAFAEKNLDEFDNLVGEYLRLRRSLRTHLIDQSIISEPDSIAADTVRKILTDGLAADKLIERFLGADFSERLDRSQIEELSDLFYGWISHKEYLEGLAELRPLVLRASAPESVSNLIAQAKDCYALRQYDAAYALCRMTLEAVVRDICIRRKLFPDHGADVPLLERYRWRDLRDKVCSGPLRERLSTLYAELSALIHARKNVSRNEARAAFSETLVVVEHLYDSNDI